MITDEDVAMFEFIRKSTRLQREKERNLTERMKSLFDPVFSALPAIVGSIGLSNIQTIRSEVRSEFSEIEDEYAHALQDEGEELAQMGSNRAIHHMQAAGMSVGFMDIDDRISGFIEQASFEASQQTLDRITGDIMGTISEGVSEGLGIDEIAENIEQHTTQMQDHELQRIARTETNNYANLSAYETERYFDLDYHKWITAQDERVRGLDPHDQADHVVLHGQIVEVGNQFSNGLKYPGDKSGPIEEFISCRCRIAPYFMPSGYYAPPNQSYFYEEDLREIQ